MSRAQKMEDIRRSLDALDLWMLRRGLCLFDGRKAPLTLIGAIQDHVCNRAVDALAETPSSDPLSERLRKQAFVAREVLKARRHALDGKGRWPMRVSERTVLAVPRENGHLRDMLLVASALRNEGVKVRWLVFREDHFDRLASTGDRVVIAAASVAPDVPRMVRLRSDLTSRSGWPVESRLAAIVEDVASAQIEPATTAFSAIDRAMETLRPDLVWVGNPLTTEGFIATSVANARGVPSATMQHGLISKQHTFWRKMSADRLTVWGPHVKDALCGPEIGLDERYVSVTGAPWVDALRRNQTADGQKPVVLVAMSGAGHVVGLEEHLGHIRQLMIACRDLPDYRWVFRLHRKDDPAIYARIKAETPGADPQVVPSREVTTTIHEALADARVMVTVTSATALDAMLHRTPVVTLARPAQEPVSGFVEAGATTHIERGADLAARMGEVMTRGEDETTTSQARQYAERYFGPLDGQATARVVSSLQSLMQ